MSEGADGRHTLTTARGARRRDVVNAAIVDAVPGSVALLDPAGVIRAVNAGWIRYGLERSLDGVLADAGTSYLDVTDAAARVERSAGEAADAIRAVLRAETDLATAQYGGTLGDIEEWYTMRVAPVHVDDERWAIVTHEDVTELRVARERWHAMFTSAAVPTALIGEDGRLLEVNAALAQLLGATVESLVGRVASDFIVEDHLEEVERRLLSAAAGSPDSSPMEVTVRRADGSTRRVVGHPQFSIGGGLPGHVVQLIDLTSQRRAESRLALHRELLELVAAGTALPEVALAVAANIGRALDGASGVVLVDGREPAASPDLPDAWLPFGTAAPPPSWPFRAAWSTPVLGADGSADAAVVVVGHRPPERDDIEAADLLASVVRLAIQRDASAAALARASLHEAERLGERLALDDAVARGVAQSAVDADDLRRALAAGEVTVHYQPIVDLATGRPTSVEALVRWQHPDRGPVPPPELIAVAESSGLIGAVGALVLTTACADLARWHAAGATDLTVAVNLSGRQLADDALVPMVREAVVASGIDPSSLVLEITESVVVEDVDEAVVALSALRSLGVRVAIDDFGTGYSSLVYLKRFPADVLKVDRTFVQGLGVHDGDTAIVDAVVALGHRLGLEVVAEGVETIEQLDELRRRRCDAAQGFLLQRPVPASEIDVFLRSGDLDLGSEPPAAAADGDLDVDELLSRISHELSTPLTVIGGHAELLADVLRREDNPAMVIDALERNIRSLDDLLRSLAGLSGALGPQGPIARLELKSFVGQTVRDLAPLLAQHDVSTRFEADGVRVVAEPAALRQILTNLLGNAVKFTAPGTGIEVVVRRCSSGGAELAIVDHGPGVPPGREGELFERFGRLGTAARGLGLGLHLSKTLARRQGIELVHERTPGGGATFVMRFA